MARKTKRKPTTDNFVIGDKVRVKRGVKDNDYPDLPLGGWAGTISAVHDDGITHDRRAVRITLRSSA